MAQSQQGRSAGDLRTVSGWSAGISVVVAVIGVVQQALIEGAQPWVIPVVVALTVVSAGAWYIAWYWQRRGTTMPRLSPARQATALIGAQDGGIAGYGFLAAQRSVLTTTRTVNLALGRDPHEQAEPDTSLVITWESDLDQLIDADVTVWRPADQGGFAVLRVDDGLRPPAGVVPVVLGSLQQSMTVTVEAWDTAAPHHVSGTAHARGGKDWSITGTGALPVPDLEGAPVLRQHDSRVVGQVTEILRDADGTSTLMFRPVRGSEAVRAAGAAASGGADATGDGPTTPPRPARRRPALLWPVTAGAAVVVLILLLGLIEPGSLQAKAPCEGGTIPVNLMVSTEKDGLVQELAADFSDTYRTESNGCVALHVSGVSSGIAKAALADGWVAPPENRLAPGTTAPEPDFWLPTSSVWPELMAAAGDDQLLAEDWDQARQSVASSVLGILMTEEKRAIHFPEGEPTWRELVDAAAADEMTLGIDDPVNSTSGMANSVALNEAFAADGEDEKVNTLRDAVASVPEGLAGLEITLLMKSLDETPGLLEQVDAVVAQEQTAFLFNCRSPLGEAPMACDAPRRDPAERLVVVQPTDGTYAFDHPVIRLARSTEDADKPAVIDAFTEYLTTDKTARAEFERWGFRPPGDPSAVTGELRENLDAAVPASINAWPDVSAIGVYQEQWQSVRLPVRVHLTIDNSGSMTGTSARVHVPGFVDACTGTATDNPDYLQLARNAALDAVKRLDNGNDWVALDAFPRPSGWKPVTLRELDGTVRDNVREAVCELDGSGENTPLYSTIEQAQKTTTEESSKPGPTSSTAIVVLSDGAQDPAADLSGLLDRIGGETAEPVISVAIGAEAPIEDLLRIADETGGAVRDLRTPEAVGDLDTVLVDVFSGLVGK